MVVTLYILSHGGLLYTAELGSPNYYVVCILELVSYGCISCI